MKRPSKILVYGFNVEKDPKTEKYIYVGFYSQQGIKLTLNTSFPDKPPPKKEIALQKKVEEEMRH